jgi:hypothetical protein
MFRCDLGHIRLSDPAIGCRGGCYSGKGVRKRPGDGHSGLATDVGVVLADAALASLGRRSAGAVGDELQRAQWPDDIATEFLSHFGLLIASRNAMRRSKPCTHRENIWGRRFTAEPRTTSRCPRRQERSQPSARSNARRRSVSRKVRGPQEGNPQNVHYAADKQQRHEHPAAADTIRSMLKREQKASRHIVAKPTVAHQKLERRLALG